MGSYTKHICGLLIWGMGVGGRVKWVRDLVSGLRIRWSGLHGGFMLFMLYICIIDLNVIMRHRKMPTAELPTISLDVTWLTA